MRVVLALVAFSLMACSSSPKQEARPSASIPAVPDDTARLPSANRVSARVVPDQMLGISKLPGGTLGEYETKQKKYQLFIIETASAQDAAILLLDLKGVLKQPKYIPWMGGYFGTNGDRNIFAFAKTKYLAGVAGLPEDAADPIARELALHLN
jgi:hypothetical protein